MCTVLDIVIYFLLLLWIIYAKIIVFGKLAAVGHDYICRCLSNKWCGLLLFITTVHVASNFQLKLIKHTKGEQLNNLLSTAAEDHDQEL